MLTPQHYHWYAANRFVFPGGLLAWWNTAGNELNRPESFTPVQIGGACLKPMTYGSESECATHYTTAPLKDSITTGSPAGLSRVNGGRSIVVLKHETSTLRHSHTVGNITSLPWKPCLAAKKLLWITIMKSTRRHYKVIRLIIIPIENSLVTY